MSPYALFAPGALSVGCAPKKEFGSAEILSNSVALRLSAVFFVVIVVVILGVAPTGAMAASETVWISELMAQNDNTVTDDFGAYSDWIEIHNGGAETVNLEGYSLTDDPADLRKWQFPAVQLRSEGHLVVFASGADRRVLGKTLHTNFGLSARGEYLALVNPDGTIAQEFSPSYPALESGVSYGLAVEEQAISRYVDIGSTARVLVPSSNIGSAWTSREFDDTAWSSARVALKYDRSSGEYDAVEGTDMESRMFGKSASVYVRIPFEQGAVLPDLQLMMRYDDGFVAYLNGQEIARRFTPNLVHYNSAATVPRDSASALAGERFNLNDFSHLLVSGSNMLAVQGLNRSSSDSDFLNWPELTARRVRVLPNQLKFFDAPTPGAANVGGAAEIATSVDFSRSTTTYTTPFVLALDMGTPTPGGVIRYTLDRSVPTESSPVYTAPLSIEGTTQVRARVFAPGMLAGPVRTETFVLLNRNVTNFTSDLPIIVIHTLGGGSIGGLAERPALITVHEPVRGRSSMLNPPHLVTRAGMKTRGSSTGGQVKANYAVEFWDDNDRPQDLSILGMPADSDWVFHAPFNFDPALIRNPLAYEMSSRLGRYAPRYRFAEVYVNTSGSGGPISAANYAGVYNIVEKIKRGKHRVDIDDLRPWDLQEPEVTGGYMLKIDRTDPRDSGFSAGGRQIAYVDPKEEEIKSPARDPQEAYIRNYINAFAAALNNRTTFTHPTRGYAPFIDAGSWIDHQIVDTLTFNVDALRLSSYFRKVRNGPLVYGPVWDYDRSLGSTDGRDVNPRVWGSGFFTETWWSRLFRDPNFWQQWIDRWQSLREGTLSDAALLQLIDDLAAQVSEAAPRDFTRWRQAKRGGSQASELQHLKNWLMSRADFMDSFPVRKPVFSHASTHVTPGFSLGMIAPPGATIYYTSDGSDPRLPGGELSTTARLYSGPISISTTATIRARARNLAHRHPPGGGGPPIISPWSGITEARFSTHPVPGPGSVVVSEIHFAPPAPTGAELGENASFEPGDFEFLELRNSSTRILDLHGAAFTSGIEFSFSATPAEVLDPGEMILLVKNRAAFAARYGERTNVAGEYVGSLNNAGERLRVESSNGEIILDVRYEGDWYPTTAAHGFSLVASSSQLATRAKLNWRPSARAGGSPGEMDPAPVALPDVVVNEVLAWSRDEDTLELHNPASTPASIGGWFLTDDPNEPKKFRIPNGTTVPAGGYLTFVDNQFNAASLQRGFGFNRAGDGAFLFSADADGNLLGYSHGFRFGAAEREVTVGRHLTSTGAERFVAQEQATLGLPNSGARVGPIVINEIMYRPPNVVAHGGEYDNHEDEYIELHNITDQPVALFDSQNPGNTWRLRSEVQFAFPANTVVPARGFLLITSFDPKVSPAALEAFRSRYGIAADVPVLGPWSGKLDNSSGNIRLMKPARPRDADAGQAPEVPYVLVDAVGYEDDMPWPVGADGLGHSLQRSSSSDYGDDPANWRAAGPTPGSANRLTSTLQITTQPQSQAMVAGASVVFRVAASGNNRMRYQWRLNGNNIAGATNATHGIRRPTLTDAGVYDVVVLSPSEAIVSEPAQLTIASPPQIVLNPQSRTVAPGTNVFMAVTVRSSGAVQYQWFYNGTPIPGETGMGLALANVQWHTTGSYTVEVRDAIGRSMSEPAEIIVLVRPVITEQPESYIAFVGDNLTLKVAAEGTPPLSYRWRRNGAYIAGQTNASLELRNLQIADSGGFNVQITNIASGRFGITSREATVTVYADFDGDRVADVWEVENGFSTNNASDALLDFDADGMSNAIEFVAGTDPRNPASLLRLDAIRPAAGGATIEFGARSNRTYVVEYRDEFTGGDWASLIVVFPRDLDRIETVFDPRPGTNRFYRLSVPVRIAPVGQ